MLRKTYTLRGALLCSAVLLTGCPAKQQVKVVDQDAPPPPVRRSVSKPLPGRTGPKIPKNIETVKLKKGLPLHLYLHEDNVMRKNPTKWNAESKRADNWKPIYIPRKQKHSFYAKLDPEPGAKLGIYTVFTMIMAVYNASAGYGSTARYSIRLILMRNDKETELFRTMMQVKGQAVQEVRTEDREIASETEVKKGDILILRLVHRTGNGGAINIGGPTQHRYKLNYIIIGTNPLTNYYQQLKPQ